MRCSGAGFRRLTILRPSRIAGERDEIRPAKTRVVQLSHFLASVLPKRFRVDPAPENGQVLLGALATAEPGCHLR